VTNAVTVPLCLQLNSQALGLWRWFVELFNFPKHIHLSYVYLEVCVLEDFTSGEPADLPDGGEVYVRVVHDEQVDTAPDTDALLSQMVVEVCLRICNRTSSQCETTVPTREHLCDR
jgi:hypothetical protein